MAMFNATPLSKQRDNIPSSALPVKSILRTLPTPESGRGSLKRGSQDDDDDFAPSSPTKKRKSVHFNMELNITTEIGKRTLEETKREVRRALDDHLRGEDEYYNELIDVFSADRQGYVPAGANNTEDTSVKPEELVYYVISLSSFAPTLTKSCQRLIKAVLSLSWLGRDDNFAKAYSQFLAAIISSRGSCTEMVLSMILEKFKYSRPSEWRANGFADVDRETMQNRLHGCVQFILHLFPTANPVFRNLMAQKFPYSDEPKNVHLMFVDNLLRLHSQYRGHSSQLDLEIMELITDRTVKLDVLFQLDLGAMDDDLVPQVLQKLNSAQADEDIEEEEDDAESIISSEPEEEGEEARIEKAAGLVAKLDGMLDRLFDLYAPSFSNPDSLDARRNFEDILSDFTNVVLQTFKSRHTQFLVFHFAQKSEEFRERFIGTLLTVIQSNRTQAIRQTAVAYLSSFAARGSHVPRESVRNIAVILCNMMRRFHDDHVKDCKGPDLRRYRQLYATFQALIYLFCYRWRDLVDSYPDIVDEDDVTSYLGQDLIWMAGLQNTLRDVIYSPFNPLKVCDPGITIEFAKLAAGLRCLYIYTKIDENKAVNLIQTSSGYYSNGGALRETGLNSADESSYQLEATFPFDPYQLPLSKRWLDGDYMPWIPIPGIDRDDDDSDDDDNDSLMGPDDDLDDEGDTATDEEHDLR